MNESSSESKPEELAEGVVLRSTGSEYVIKLEAGSTITAILRGKFRQEGFDSTNPIAVGDRVFCSAEEGNWVIKRIGERENYILRKSTNLKYQRQILAANVDQAVFIMTVEYPFTPLGYLDRFLVMCEAYHIPVTIVFNKIDLLKQKQKHWYKLADYRAIYEEAGYPHLALSATDERYRPAVADLLRNRTTFLGGKSGSGKSSLVNLVDPTLQLTTKPLTRQSHKGRHTTTYAEMHLLTIGGAVIDAPGFRDFEVVGMEKEELSHYYPEMRSRLAECRFNNCLHINEPGCAVKAAVEEGEVALSRYNTYQSILESIKEQKTW